MSFCIIQGFKSMPLGLLRQVIDDSSPSDTVQVSHFDRTALESDPISPIRQPFRVKRLCAFFDACCILLFHFKSSLVALFTLILAIRSLLIFESQSQTFLLERRKAGSNLLRIKLAAEVHLRSQLSVFDEFTIEVSDLHNRHH
jgi:hypothetical protein